MSGESRYQQEANSNLRDKKRWPSMLAMRTLIWKLYVQFIKKGSNVTWYTHNLKAGAHVVLTQKMKKKNQIIFCNLFIIISF